MARKTNSAFMRDFISEENRNYRLRIGSSIASSLAGILCGVILASIVWAVALYSVVQITQYIIK